GPPVLQPAVAAGRDLDLDPQLEVLECPAPPGEEAVVLERPVGLAGEAASINGPVLGAPLPAGEVSPVEDGLETFRRPGGVRLAPGRGPGQPRREGAERENPRGGTSHGGSPEGWDWAGGWLGSNRSRFRAQRTGALCADRNPLVAEGARPEAGLA